MPRSVQRACDRAARVQSHHAYLQERIDALVEQAETAATPAERVAVHRELVTLLKAIGESDYRLWSFDIGGDDETQAMIAQLVNAALAGKRPGWVRLRSPGEYQVSPSQGQQPETKRRMS